MKFISYRHNGSNALGVLKNDLIANISTEVGCTDMAQALRMHGQAGLLRLASSAEAFQLSLDKIEAYRPAVADAQRIFCVGLNYEEHRVEAGRARTANPTVFLRLSSSQVAHNQPIVIPQELPEGLDFEGEIAVVIGNGGRRISSHVAYNHIFGYSIYNDASARSWQAHSTQWTAGKNFPSTGAFGPYVVSADEVGHNPLLSLTTRLNGEVVQHADTHMMTFPIADLIAYISSFTALEPGDVIVTGTPGGVGFKRTPPLLMQAGDVAEVEVSMLGTLRNVITQEPR